MRVPALSADDLSELRDFGLNLHESTPFWYYVLKEAEVMENGLRLGPVGARLVGEVIIGLLQLDRNSFMADEPHWRPTLPTRSGKVTGEFTMVDFLSFCGRGADAIVESLTNGSCSEVLDTQKPTAWVRFTYLRRAA